MKQGSLGDLNPTPWAVMTGNCTGWIVYSFLLKVLNVPYHSISMSQSRIRVSHSFVTCTPQNWFIFWANAPGLIISIWLNMAAAKLQYCDRLSEDIRKSMVNFLKENSHLMGESAMNFGRSSVQENDGEKKINSRRASLLGNLSPPHRKMGSSTSSGGLASTAALLQQFYHLELKEGDEDHLSADGDDDSDGKDEELGQKGERLEENDTSISHTSEVIGNSQESSQTTTPSDRRVVFQEQKNTPAINTKATKLLGLSNTSAPHSARLLEMMEYADVHAASTSPPSYNDNIRLFPGTRASVVTHSPAGNTLERLTKVALDVAIQKSEAPAPHERVLVVIVGIWLLLIASISLFNVTPEQRLTIIGISVNLNISFFYGAPLSTIVKVIKTRDSSSIHRYTMMLNTGCAIFFMLFGIGVQDNYLIVPNGIGVALGVTQAFLRTVIPNKDNLYPEEDKALAVIRSVIRYVNSSISMKPKQGTGQSTKAKTEYDDGKENEDAFEMESAKEFDNVSISSTSISSTDFLQYLYSSIIPKQLERRMTTKKDENNMTIPKQIVEGKLPVATAESEVAVDETVSESDDQSDKSSDFLQYLYFTPSNKL